MAVGAGHRLVPQALLGASVVVVVVCGLFVGGVALVPASQVFGHQRLLDVPGDMLVAPLRLAVPGRPQSGIRVLRHAVYFVVSIMGVHLVAVVSRLRGVVGWIDVIVAFQLVVVHVDAVGVWLRFRVGGVTCDVVGGCGGAGPGLVGVTTRVRLGQVGHAPRVGVQVFFVAAACPSSGGVVAGGAVLHTGLAGVGGAVVENFSAVAASGGGEGECWHWGVRLRHQELRLGLQTPTPLAEMLRGVVRSKMKKKTKHWKYFDFTDKLEVKNHQCFLSNRFQVDIHSLANKNIS